MAGEQFARLQNIANMAAARFALQLERALDAYMADPDPLHDTIESAYMKADQHGHAYGAPCPDAYCQKIRDAVVAALPKLAQAAFAPSQPQSGALQPGHQQLPVQTQ